VWAVYRKLLASRYNLQEDIGMYQMWRINAHKAIATAESPGQPRASVEAW
jgi:hypothetical protein